MNPIDEYMELRKEAGLMDLLRGVGKGLSGAPKPWAMLPGRMGPAGAGVAHNVIDAAQHGYELGQKAQVPLALAAAGGIALAVKKLHGAMTKQRDFKAMMQLNPQLAEAQQQRPEMFNQAYSSLRKLNPTFGADPVVAGAYMHKMMVLNPEQAGMILADAAGAKAPAGVSLSGIKMGPLSFK